MNTCFAFLTWTCTTLLIIILVHLSPCWYSHLFMDNSVAVLTLSCVPVLTFRLCKGSLVDILTWVCVSILQLISGHVSPCCYSFLVMYPSVGIPTWSCIPVHYWSYVPILALSLGHVSYSWYFHLVTCPHVDICTWSCIPMWIFSLSYVSPWWGWHWSCISVLMVTLGVTSCYW